MASNHDDKSGDAGSFDFAPRDVKKITEPDLRYEKTAHDDLASSRNSLAARNAPHLQNARRLTGNDMEPPDPYAEDLTGKFVAQNYQILEKVGEGGMSAVYRARHMHLNREVAVKMLHPHLVSNRVSRERFSQEARAVSQIEHQNVVRIIDFGITEENRPYIVMDFLRGSSLTQYIKENGGIDLDDAISVFLQIADALAYTHDKNIIHRDLKPSNVILLDRRQRSREGDETTLVAKIVDFGIAKLMPHEDAGVAALTQTGEVFGSPLYMSPEQARGDRLDNRSDIYSMGCLMYECLTGEPAINGSNLLEILYRHMNEMPRPLSVVAKEKGIVIPRALEAIIFKALAKDPKDRYQDMRSLSADLKNFSQSGSGALASLSSLWSIYRSRRKRLNLREKVALAVTSLALLVVIVSTIGLGVLYFKGTQDIADDLNLTWYTTRPEARLQSYTTPRDRLVTFSLTGATVRIEELKKMRDQSDLNSTESDSEMVQVLMNNAIDSRKNGSLDDASILADKAIELGALVHGYNAQIVREALYLKMMICYNKKQYEECIRLIGMMQRNVNPASLYMRNYKRATIFSILGECEFHLKHYEKAQTDLLEALHSWETADNEKEQYEPALLEIKALAYSYFAECFTEDKLWEESIKYYQKAFDCWQQVGQPMADYNQALALFKESQAYAQMNDGAKSDKLFNKALDVLHRQPKDFYFYQTGIEMMQLSAKVDQAHGNWISAIQKFANAGMAMQRTNENGRSKNDQNGQSDH